MKWLDVVPKLPMRDKDLTKNFYIHQLEFKTVGDIDFEGYLMVEKGAIEIHFFEFKTLDPMQNDGQIYIRVQHIEELYAHFLAKKITIHPNGPLETKPWGQKEFSILDPDFNLLTFGESV